jgi:tRNA(fMet)-specific endonuclease VapC
VDRYLIDTDWAIDYMRGKPEAVSILDSLPEDSAFISVVSVAELYEGAFLSRDPSEKIKSLEDFLSDMIVLQVTEQTAPVFGEQRAKLRRRGLLIDNLDLLIAATCLEHGLRLLTNNVAHFERINGLQIGLAER